MRPALTDAEYRWFSDWLKEEYGLVFGPEKRDILGSRLDPRRVELGFDTFERLYFHLKFHPDREAEREKLVPHLTNNESYFLREPAQIEVLIRDLLPGILEGLAARKRREVRILSAGCAAGEEPYSIAISLLEHNPLPPGMRVRITGLDLDPHALERARAAIYGENAFRRFPQELRERYFAPVDDGRWQLNSRVRGMVDLLRGNLATADWRAKLPAQDVIFCRNVLIYFDDRTMGGVAESFHDALVPGGYLFLGHAESLSRVPTRMTTVRRPGAIFYQRPEHG